MKKIVFSLAMLISHLTSAATPIDGWYSSVFGGYAYLPNNLNVSPRALHFSNAQYRTGYNAGASFGFKNSPMRYEGEFTYINATPKHFNIDGFAQTGVKGFNTAYLGMANVYYDFPAIIDPLQPFLGVGLGYGYLDAQFRSDDPFSLIRYKANDSVFGYQGTAGITFNFSEYCALYVAYRYLGTSKVDDYGKEFQAHLANVGAVYRFDIAQYK